MRQFKIRLYVYDTTLYMMPMVVLFAYQISLTKRETYKNSTKELYCPNLNALIFPMQSEKCWTKFRLINTLRSPAMGLLVCKSVNLSFMKLSLYMYGQNPIKKINKFLWLWSCQHIFYQIVT